MQFLNEDVYAATIFQNRLSPFRRINIFSAGFDQFLFRLALYVPEVSILIQSADVAGVVPAFPEGVVVVMFQIPVS